MQPADIQRITGRQAEDAYRAAQQIRPHSADQPLAAGWWIAPAAAIGAAIWAAILYAI